MELETIEATLEALLFTMGNSVPLKDLAAVIEHDEETTRKIMHQMMDKYVSSKRGLTIIELDDAFQMCTKPEYYDAVIKLTHQPKRHVLTDVVLETLSIVAYKQPVTRAQIEQIRGVSCDHAINKLVEYGLIEEAGRLDAPGRPILFATTEEFLRTFGIKNMEELPVLNPEQIDVFQTEAEQEAQMTLDV